MTTIGDLSDLLKMALTHTGNPALRRLPEVERTVTGLARAYLASRCLIDVPADGHGPGLPAYTQTAHLVSWLAQYASVPQNWPLSLTDPGTAHALLVALTLATGRDPGEGGLGVSWYRTRSGAWRLDPGSDLEDAPDEVEAPDVAIETSPVGALEQAVAHVLRGSVTVAPAGGDQ